MIDDKFMTLFNIEDYTSEERYDLAKFIPWKEDTYDVLNSPFLLGLMTLPVNKYYRVNDGYKDIDLIAEDAYGSVLYSSLVQIYNNTTKETFEEDEVLRLFSVEDLEQLYKDISDNNFENIV